MAHPTRSRLPATVPVDDITAPSYPPREQANFGRMPLLQALRRHWPLAVLPVLLLVAAAIVIGLQREPLPQPPEGPRDRVRVGSPLRQEPQQRQEVLRGGRRKDPTQHREPADAQQQPVYLPALHTTRHFISDQPFFAR